MRKFIAVAGNMGVGKSALTGLLAQKLGWKPYSEAVADNPYLADFYKDMKRWSFHSQVFFLSRRLYDSLRILKDPEPVIQDRCMYEDAEIFARNLYLQGHMQEKDWHTYWELYELMRELVPAPELIIYLRASVPTLLKRINHRGRDYEQGVSIDYLEQLNRLYEEWVAGFSLCPTLIIPADELDFVKHEAHLEQIAAWLSYKALPEFFKSRPASVRRRRGRKVPQAQPPLPGVEWRLQRAKK